MEKISDIKSKYLCLLEEDRKGGYSGNAFCSFVSEYGQDERSGVKEILKKVERYSRKIAEEKKRIFQMAEMERLHAGKIIVGVDEVGRGPLAGPVVAGAVILNPEDTILFLNDSKQLTDAKRRELAEIIKRRSLGYATALVSPQRIDEINILQATLEAMSNAILKLTQLPDLVLCDAVQIPQIPIPQIAMIKGDARSISIAAASIIAKVERDDLMVAYDSLYPEYQFAKNKGYGTAEHLRAIQKYGSCEIHRQSFLKNLLSIEQR